MLRFGTDGVRGVAFTELTEQYVAELGMVAARELGVTKVLIGRDTRESGKQLETALANGLLAGGVSVELLGVAPTPAIAFLAAKRGCASAAITASHNPYLDNGVKLFANGGVKLSDAQQDAIESHMTGSATVASAPATQVDLLGEYASHIVGLFPVLAFANIRVVLDCANGAAYKSSPCILRELGADLVVHNNHPTGTNINTHCGSTHPEHIQRFTQECKAQIGITHDGDADRMLLCDENGELVDGDEIMAIAAVDYLKRGCLNGNTLVATVMSNFGLDETLEAHGGRVLRTKVGDRYVIEAMLREGYNVGGEQSGHMIFGDFATTGDGIVSALQILRVMIETGQPLSELKKVLKKYPQAQRNLRVKDKPALETISGLQTLLNEAESTLKGKGRVLLRYSGTEPKIRLLLEGREQDVIDQHADRIAGLLQEAIGA